MRKTGRKVALLSGLALVVLAAVLAWVNWGWFVFLLEFEALGRNTQGYSEFRHRRTGIVFVRLPGRTFRMGSPEDEPGCFDHEIPVHSVDLSPFVIGGYEISQAQWERIMGNNPSRFQGDDLPVEQVSWEDCKAFCARTGLSFPTEAQWEYACRAGTTTPFAFGTLITKQQANFDAERTAEVVSLKPNGFGLYNMHGNVWEWCDDVFDPDFYHKPEAWGDDPLCRSGSKRRVVRGGSWFHCARHCRSAYRFGLLPSVRNDFVGFRPAAPAP